VADIETRIKSVRLLEQLLKAEARLLISEPLKLRHLGCYRELQRYATGVYDIFVSKASG